MTSFNTRWGLDVDDRPFDWMGACAAFDSDLIVLQEVWEPTDGSGPLRHRAADLGYSVHHAALSPSLVDPRPEITAEVDDAAGTWGVALLSRRPVVATRQVEMGRMFERWDVASRPVLLADVAIGDDLTVTVAAIHLSFALPNAVAQLRRLGGLLSVERPGIIAGDCNLWGRPTVRLLGGSWRRAVKGRTWPADRPHSQLDHILVTPHLRVVDGHVLRGVGSDHLPVQATLDAR